MLTLSADKLNGIPEKRTGGPAIGEPDAKRLHVDGHDRNDGALEVVDDKFHARGEKSIDLTANLVIEAAKDHFFDGFKDSKGKVLHGPQMIANYRWAIAFLRAWNKRPVVMNTVSFWML
jgi:hypothetical protein